MFTEKTIREAKAKEKTYILWDNQIKGLGLRITAKKGVKSYILNYRVNGRERRMTIGRVSSISLKAARTKVAEHLEGIQMDGIDPLEVRQAAREAPTVQDGLNQFFNDYAPAKIVKGKLKQSTLTEYQKHSTRYVEPFLGKLRINEVRTDDVEKMLNTLPRPKDKTVKTDRRTQHNRVLAFTQRLFNFFIEKGLRNSANPCLEIERAKEEARDRVLSPSELAALAKALNQHEKQHPASVAAIRIAALTGLRIGEILKIEWSHIDFESGRLTIPDSKSGRRIHSLPKSVLEIISKLPKFPNCPWIFTTRGKAPVTYKVVRARLSGAAKAAGLSDVRLHDFRRTAMTLLAASGAPAPIIQQFVGHASIEMALRYVKSINEPVHQARADVANTVQRMMDGDGEGELRIED